ncbi:MAG TPA: hypothetical protein VLX12_10125 [Syntrophorhabdales bacterium]|nr:hypothetical protein [Syntrophorhabdales bacterium]
MMLKVKPAHKRLLLLLFSAYFLCAVITVAFDLDRATPSKTCAICFMNGSLSSAVGQAFVVVEIDLKQEYAHIFEEASSFNTSVRYSGLSYRGPPLPIVSFL